MNSSVVLECQCFKDFKNQFIIKELAYASCNDEYYRGVYLFKPPHPFPDNIKDLDWTLSYHGFSWTEGVENYQNLEMVLKNITSGFDAVYTKGLEKSNFLSDILNRQVIDLDEIIHKRLDQLASSTIENFQEEEQCPFHVYKNGNFRCAYANALNLSKWMMNSHCADDNEC